MQREESVNLCTLQWKGKTVIKDIERSKVSGEIETMIQLYPKEQTFNWVSVYFVCISYVPF